MRFLRGIDRRWLAGRMQRFEKADQRLNLRGRKILAVGRHVAAAGHHLEAQLVDGHARGHIVKRRAALAADSANRVAVAALLGLEDHCALPDQRRCVVQIAHGNADRCSTRSCAGSTVSWCRDA